MNKFEFDKSIDVEKMIETIERFKKVPGANAIRERIVEVMLNVVPMWQEGVEYTEGCNVIYNNVVYKVIQPHTSTSECTPDVNESMFENIFVIN